MITFEILNEVASRRFGILCLAHIACKPLLSEHVECILLVAGFCCRNQARYVSIAARTLACAISEEWITLVCAFPTDVAIVLGLDGSWEGRCSLVHDCIHIGLDCGLRSAIVFEWCLTQSKNILPARLAE